MTTVGRILRKAASTLEKHAVSQALLDASVLLADVLKREAWWLSINRDHPVTTEQAIDFEKLVARRARGEPVAYLTGHREFWSRNFAVDNRVLIPRPETELAVETAMEVLAHDHLSSPLILDLGTGSGCIAITLALEIKTAIVVASDISLDALRLAALNAEAHNVGDRVHLIQADWTSCFRIPETDDGPDLSNHYQGFDLIVANPPYIAPAETNIMDREVLEFEPRLALFSNDEGLGAIKSILKGAPCIMKEGGWLVCEIGWKQGKEVTRIADETGNYHYCRIKKDYSGNDRILILQRN